MKRLLFIYNPHAGKAKITGHLSEIVELFQKHGYLTTLYATQGKGDGVWAGAALAKEYDHVVCCGGDGTLSEVVTGLKQWDYDGTLGYIPAGTTNDFSKTLQIPGDLMEAAKLAVAGQPKQCDVGLVNEHHLFTYVAAFGVFTEVSYATSQHMKNLLGHTAYLLEGIKSLANLKPVHMKITWDEGEIEDDFIYGMVSNTLSVGGFRGVINQKVILDDGLFEALLIRCPQNLYELNQITASLLSRSPNEHILSLQTRNIDFVSDELVDWTLDGEFGGHYKNLTICNQPAFLTIFCGKEEEA